MRALVLSGGGAYGAFQVGVIQQLASMGARWDLIVGTSVGAINGAFLSQAHPHEQHQRALQLRAMWESTDESDVYHPNLLGLLGGILPLSFLPYRPSIYDTKPLRRLIEREITLPSATRLIVSAVSLDDGSVQVIDSNRVRDVRPWVLASASIPIVFPPVEINGKYYVDGGVRANNPIELAIRAGATEMDVVLCLPTKRLFWSTPLFRRWGLTDIAVLTLKYSLQELYAGDAPSWAEHGPVPVRVYAPDSVPAMSPIKFDRPSLTQLIDHGVDVAARQNPVLDP